MLKVALIAEHYPPTDGGVATSAQRVARELAKQGVSVQVLCFDCDTPIESFDKIITEDDCGVFVKRVAPFFLKHKNLHADALPEKIKATLRRRAVDQMICELHCAPVDCILSFYLLNAGFLAQFVARELRVPIIAGVRGNDIGRNIFNVERFAVIQWVVHGAHRIVCVNQHLNNRLMLAFPEAQEKISVIPNSVPPLCTSTTQEAARNHILQVTQWPTDSLIMVFIGNLREKKGIMPLIKALQQSQGNRARLLVIGPGIGSVEKRIVGADWQALIERGYVFCTGQLKRPEIPDWALGGDVILMPSVEDGMANGLLEGMSLGLCPLVTEVFSDVVEDSKNGLVVPPNDDSALAKAILRLSTRPDLVRSLGAQAALTIERQFRPAIEGNRYRQLLTDLVNEQH